MRTYVLVVGVAISSLIATFIPTTVFAASSSGTNITTSPVSADLKVSPGKSVTTTISVQNNAAKPITIQLQLQTFKPYGENGRAQVIPPKPNSAYISCTTRRLESDPNDHRPTFYCCT
jgi:hypothetical protein